MAQELFKNKLIASYYVKFRPRPPVNLLRKTISSIKSSSGEKVAVDVGCGSGQCTALLSDHFDYVYGFDVSCDQIEQAVENNNNIRKNVQYQVSPAETIPLSSSSVDLVTVCQAFHYFDQTKFYAEVDRLLKPGGVIALITHLVPFVNLRSNDNKTKHKARNLILNCYHHAYMEPYIDDVVKIVDNGYKDVRLPYDDEERLCEDVIREEVSGIDLENYIRSWSPFNALLKADEAKAEQVMNDFRAEVTNITGHDMDKIQFDIVFPYYLLLANKPL